MGLSYLDVKAIVADTLKGAANDEELLALRAANAELKAENQQLKDDIAGAVDKTDDVEQGARAGLPAQP